MDVRAALTLNAVAISAVQYIYIFVYSSISISLQDENVHNNSLVGLILRSSWRPDSTKIQILICRRIKKKSGTRIISCDFMPKPSKLSTCFAQVFPATSFVSRYDSQTPILLTPGGLVREINALLLFNLFGFDDSSRFCYLCFGGILLSHKVMVDGVRLRAEKIAVPRATLWVRKPGGVPERSYFRSTEGPGARKWSKRRKTVSIKQQITRLSHPIQRKSTKSNALML